MALAELYTGGIMPGITQGADLAAKATNIRGAQTRNRLADLALQNAPSEMQRQNRLLDLQIQGRESGLAADRQKQGITRLELLSRALSGFGDPSAVKDDAQANELWQAARRALGSAGVDVEGMPETTTAAEVRALAGLASRTGMDASTRNFEYLTRGLSPEEVERARRIELGLDPRAVGSSSITIAKDNLTDVVAGSQGKIKEEEGAGSERGKGSVKTRRGLIDDGLDAISQIPTLTRTLELLDEVETGGIQSRAGLALKQQFGIEGADEGELSANLGKAILGQLRSTFGAQFTEREGARLERIEAGFGKSTETNRRLIRSALDTVIRTARRGLRAAEQDGDEFAAEEIRNAIASLEGQREAVSGGRQAAQPEPQGAAPQAGGQQRMRYNPQTGDLEPVG